MPIIPMAIATAAATTAVAAPVVMPIYGASQEAKQQKKLIEYQEGQVAAAEAKVAGAEKLAAENAVTTLKKKRLAQTNTILTSPLGLSEEANLGLPSLLGGS